MGKNTDSLTLVVGGLGYIGSALVPTLAKTRPVRVFDSMMFGNCLEGTPNVEFVKGDVRDRQALKDAIIGVRDVVWLAGIVTDELVDMNQQLSWDINVGALEAFCRVAKTRKRRFVYASSSSIYGTQDRVCTEEMTPYPMTAYAKQKLEGERVVASYGFESLSVRSATACGPAPRMRLDTIVNIFSKQAYFDGTITVWDGSQWRSNIHVQDIADLYIKLLDVPYHRPQVYNATAGNHTALELAIITAKAFEALQGVQTEIVMDKDKRDGRHYRMDASKLKRDLGWEPKRSIRQAVLHNIAHFAAGNVADPQDPIYTNTKRMAGFMRTGG